MTPEEPAATPDAEGISGVLASAEVFKDLPEPARRDLAARASARSVERDAVVAELGNSLERIGIIASGGLEVRSATGKIFARLTAGQSYGVHAVLAGTKPNYRVVATEDTRIVEIPRAALLPLAEATPDFEKRFAGIGFQRREGRGEPVPTDRDAAVDLMTTSASELMTAGLITTTSTTPMIEAARIMRDKNVSCLPVVDDEKLVGIITDTDLRNRIVAEGADVTQPVSAYMSTTLSTLESDALAFDALILMMHRDIAHLPITSGGKLAGILTHTNLVRAQSRSAVYMIGEIHRFERVEDMAAVVRQIPELLVTLVESGASAYKIGRIVTAICDAVTHRLIALAEDRLGPAPVPYVWAACGSQGRQEQTGVSDQDNCLILHDSYDPAQHGQYFEDFAKFVSDGLDACGYFYCPGDMMATNPQWRQPLANWKSYFREWIDNPGPKAQMLASVMFDQRPIHGDRSLFDALQSHTLERARKNSIFIAHLLSNALTHGPPLGFFGTLTTEGGEHRGKIDLKHTGVVPVVDIARVYALEAAISDVNTHDRLQQGRAANVLSQSGSADLLAAFEFIAITRLRHQVRQIRSGRKPDNYMSPDEISHLERDQLKKAFQVVKTIQSALSNAHQIGAR